MKHITHADMRIMPWKNGLGSTTEIAIFPGGASVTDLSFAWRLSAAEIRQEGPFSKFEGYDRILVVTTEGGLLLEASGLTPRNLPAFEVFNFHGEDEFNAKPPAGCEFVSDVGLIYRRDLVRATMSVLKIPMGASVMLPLQSEFTTHVFIGLTGTLDIRNAGRGSITFEKGEAVLIEKGGLRRGGLGRTSVAISSRSLSGDTYLAVVALSVRAAADRLGSP